MIIRLFVGAVLIGMGIIGIAREIRIPKFGNWKEYLPMLGALGIAAIGVLVLLGIF